MIDRSDFCRELRPGEENAVADLLRAAFGTEDEVTLVDRLRKSGAIAGEMVLPGEHGSILGYYALSHFQKPKGWLCLAPVAVHPDIQGQHRGKRMIGQLIAWATATGQTIVVLGQVGFYESCGFSAARAARLTSPYPVAHTLLAGSGQDTPRETLIYPAAFDTL